MLLSSTENCRLFRKIRQACGAAIVLVVASSVLSPLASLASDETGPANLNRARVLAERGRFDDAVKEYCRVLRDHGDSKPARLGLERMLMERFPTWIEPDWYGTLPLAWSQEIRDDARTEPSGLLAIIAQPAAYLPVRSGRDPVSGARLCCSAYVYVNRGERFRLAVSVFSNDVSLARGVAQAAFWVLEAARSFREADGTPRLSVWVARAREPSGATVGQDLRINCSEADLGTFDLYRVLAHEMGHALLPRVCGFTEPEPCAEGYLGEALFLADGAAFTGEDAAGQAELAAKARERAAALMDAFDVDSSQGLPGDLRGIRILTGAALELWAKGGAEKVAFALRSEEMLDKDALFLAVLGELRSGPARRSGAQVDSG